MSDAAAFEGFPTIPHLRRGCIITEMIDGTNALVVVPADDGPLLIGSRNRWIKVGDDNCGFAAWCALNELALRDLGPGRHFGEWYGLGIQRRYGLDHKQFALFRTDRPADTLPPGINQVPVLYEGEFTDTAVDSCLRGLASGGSMAVPGFMNPEGIVVWHKASGTRFKVTLDHNDKAKEAA